MTNLIYPKLDAPKLTSWMFNGLRGITVPARSTSNTGNVGTFIDNYIKTQLGISNMSTTVDLASLGIEVKSKDIHTNTDWSIGSMTLQDILDLPYKESSIYKKLQALLLVTTDDTFQIIKDISLHYFDIDEIQLLLEDSYERARAEIQERVSQHALNTAQQIMDGNINSILNNVEFNSYEKFHGDYGKFEYTNNGNSFMFRITIHQMKHLTNLSNAHQSILFEFE